MLNKTTPILMMGSCFSTEVGSRLEAAGYPVTRNPFGILFNPASIAKSLERLESREPFTAADIIPREGQFCSFHHHGSFRRPTPEAFLENANTALLAGAEAFNAAQVVVLTLGTAWVFRHIERNIIVSNCHKVPAREFSRERLSVDEVVHLLAPIVARHSDKRWILTVSPVRHLADGLHGNQVSKSTLILAADALVERFPNVEYFPAYEIMVEEFRESRWWAANGTHPAPEAVDLICDRFKATL